MPASASKHFAYLSMLFILELAYTVISAVQLITKYHSHSDEYSQDSR